MTRYVVDASVAIKWFLPEAHAGAAHRLLAAGVELLAPDLIRAEVGNVVWKKWRQGEIDDQAALDLLRDFQRFPLQIHSSEMLVNGAWDIARRFDRSFYDSLYLALAANNASPLVTADLRFYRALKDRLVGAPLVWVEDVL